MWTHRKEQAETSSMGTQFMWQMAPFECWCIDVCASAYAYCICVVDNISGSDINDCRLKLILGLIWTLILRYQIHQGADGNTPDSYHITSKATT
jgi:hypothetical protein